MFKLIYLIHNEIFDKRKTYYYLRHYMQYDFNQYRNTVLTFINIARITNFPLSFCFFFVS